MPTSMCTCACTDISVIIIIVIIIWGLQYDTLKDIGAHNRASVVFVPQSGGDITTYDEDIRKGFAQGAVTHDIGRDIARQ